MITAWDIYWVMQLDSIGVAFHIASILAVIAAGVMWITGAIFKSCGNTFPEMEQSKREAAIGSALHRRATPVTILAGSLVLASAFIPSTKTAAAMIVLPALSDIASSETVQHEAGELYGIAKNALRELAKPKPEPKKDDSPERVTP